jgi:hypothetical protein
MGTSVLGMSSNVSFLLRKKHFKNRIFFFWDPMGGGLREDVMQFSFFPLFLLDARFCQNEKNKN